MSDSEVRPTGLMRCPACRAVFDMFAPGQMVIGADGQGIYMEHVPCGHRGRPGYGAKGERND